jgi:hypothetical protein
VKIIPPGMNFEHALRSGYTGKILCRGYLDWQKTLPCWRCEYAPGDSMRPIDPSHYNGLKGMGTKSTDLLSIPECRTCHEEYELRGADPEQEADRLRAALMYLVRAFWEGRLVWHG